MSKIKLFKNFLAYLLLKFLSHSKNKKTENQLLAALKHDNYDPKISNLYLQQVKRYIDYKDKCVIDIGCGTGDFAITLAKTGAKKVVGIDIDQRHIKSAKKKALIEKVEDKITFICHDFNTYKPNELFDIAFSLNAFEHIPSVRNSLYLINKILGPKAVLFTVFGPLWASPYGAHMTEFTKVPWVHFLFPEEVVLKVRTEYYRPDDSVNKYEDVRGHLNRITIKNFKYYASESGFEIENLRVNPEQDKGKYRFINNVINNHYPLDEIFSFQLLAILNKV